MFNAKALTEKWSPVLTHEGAGAIKDNYRKDVTAVLLENTENAMREERGMITEASNTVGAIGTNALSGSGLDTKTGGLAGFDPVMIGMIRRAMPNLVAYDICGVQPMSYWSHFRNEVPLSREWFRTSCWFRGTLQRA